MRAEKAQQQRAEQKACFPKTGRQRMALKEYEKWSKKKIAAIEAEMATITDKSDPRWRKLRKQRAAQQCRLRKKNANKSNKTKLELLDDVMGFLLKQITEHVPEEKQAALKADIL